MNSFVSHIPAIVAFLNQPHVIQTSGFCSGFLWRVGLNKEITRQPLVTICEGAVEGCQTFCGASLIMCFLPSRYGFIIPVVVGLSLLNKHLMTPLGKYLWILYLQYAKKKSDHD